MTYMFAISMRRRDGSPRCLQSGPGSKHIEANAKPSICLFLLKSEPWDKHIYAYYWIFHFEVFGHRKLCQQICWRSTFLTEEDDKSACQRSVLFALVPLHMYRRRVKFRSMVCGCSLYEVWYPWSSVVLAKRLPRGPTVLSDISNIYN